LKKSASGLRREKSKMANSPDRVIALKLHALHEEDREWILSRLDPASYKHLQALLGELKELKFNVDAALLRSVKHQANPTSSVKDEDIRLIDTASSEQIKNIFDNEPRFLLNCLAVQYEWKWLPDFNKNTRTEIKGTISPRGKYKNITAKAKKALLKVVAERVKLEAKPLKAKPTELKITALIRRQLTRIQDKVLSWKR